MVLPLVVPRRDRRNVYSATGEWNQFQKMPMSGLTNQRFLIKIQLVSPFTSLSPSWSPPPPCPLTRTGIFFLKQVGHRTRIAQSFSIRVETDMGSGRWANKSQFTGCRGQKPVIPAPLLTKTGLSIFHFPCKEYGPPSTAIPVQRVAASIQ